MRQINNPFKNNVPVPQAPDVSLAVVTHYTDHVYHARRLEVVKLCLDTLIGGMQGIPYELLVWDNGSTREFRQMLMSYKPTMFVQSVNVGAHNGRHALCEMARGKLICFTDDDILFHPDWFHLQYEVLTTYPSVGLVSGSPHRFAFRKAISANLEWAQKTEGATMVCGQFIPKQWEIDFARSIGANETSIIKAGQKLNDYEFEYKGVKAWAQGHHMQFLAYREVIAPFITRTPVLLDATHYFNDGPNNAGLLQLTTHRRTAVHIGNVVDDSIRRIHAEFTGEAWNKK